MSIVKNNCAKYAGFTKRAVALVIDYIIILAANFLAAALLLSSNMEPDTVQALSNGLPGLLAWVYCAGMESSSVQGTIGKRILGIKVTDMNGKRIGFGKATGRYFGRLLSVLIMCIGFLMVLFTEKKQALHDILAGCLVVNRQ